MRINKLYHISDIHLRLYKRHKEYQQVFNRLFDYIKETKTEDSCIVLTGDIVHNKTDMSPELIQITSNFFSDCADLLPTVLILGNHDVNLNSTRLDALTPIVDAVNHPNLFYYKDSGIYKTFENVDFYVFGILNNRENWPQVKRNKNIKVGLHHGPVIGSKTELTTLTTGITTDVFQGMDFVLLGDIHSVQYLNDEKTIAFAGSLIQQDYGESVNGHGLLVWDLKKKTSEFVPIKNDYGYYTFDIINGKCDIPNDLPKNLRVRVRYENTSQTQLEDFIKKISKKYNILELVKQKSKQQELTLQSSHDLLSDSRDVNFQNKIISELLKVLNPDIQENEIQEVLNLNIETNKLLPVHNQSRNVIWKPILLEFSNMFSYGEDNRIDFSKFNGSYGIFAGNHMGKSALFDILSFSIYDKSTRATKASHIINTEKSSFQCKLTFELNGQTYFIERLGTRKTDGNVKVDVNFWTLNEDGEVVNLNGEDRDKTNFQIRNYLGTYDDFVMTALSTQYDNQNFVEKSQRDRKELLYKFLDIFVYDDLYKIAKENSKELQVLIREYEKEDLHQKSSQIYNKINEDSDQLIQITLDLDEVKDKIKEFNNDLVQLNKSFVPVENNLNIDKIEFDIERITNDLKFCVNELDEVKSIIEHSKNQKEEILTELSTLEPYKDFETINSQFKEQELKVREYEYDVKDIEKKLRECYKKQNQLHDHKYDPNCDFCVNNEFVKDAQGSITMIPELEKLLESKHKQFKEFQTSLISFKQNLDFSTSYVSLFSKIGTLDNTIHLSEEKLKTIQYKGKNLNSTLKGLLKDKEDYFKNETQIQNNEQIQHQIQIVKTNLERLEKEESKYNKQHRDLDIEIKKLQSQYDDCNLKLDKYLDYIKKYRTYELYTQTISRDGVPYKIVELVLPVLEHEVNLILNQVASFNVKLEATDEKYIHAFIQYQNQSWPIELSSGMERFILGLAFRVALTELTSLPKANFLAIDEGFGVLDQDNILQIGKLFQYFKDQYEFVICVSHIDTMRDLVDNHIKIEKQNGYSKVMYNAV